MNILIGSKSPKKIQGAKEAFDNYFTDFDIAGVSVSSNVSDEPINAEIYRGARNRVNNLISYAVENGIDAEYFLGIESGVTNLLGRWINVNIAVIKDINGYESWGVSAGFPVPDRYIEEILSTELGLVMDKVFNQDDTRTNAGDVSDLTGGVISRVDLTRDAFVMALVQHLNKVWTDKGELTYIEEEPTTKDQGKQLSLTRSPQRRVHS